MAAVVDASPDEVAQALTGRPYLSYSAIRTFTNCPLRWYFRYVLALPERTVSASLVLGAAVHRAVERHFRARMLHEPTPTLDDLMAEYHAAWRERADQLVLYGRGDDRSKLDQRAIRMLTAFRASEIARPRGRIVGVETELAGESSVAVAEIDSGVAAAASDRNELIGRIGQYPIVENHHAFETQRGPEP